MAVAGSPLDRRPASQQMGFLGGGLGDYGGQTLSLTGTSGLRTWREGGEREIGRGMSGKERYAERERLSSPSLSSTAGPRYVLGRVLQVSIRTLQHRLRPSTGHMFTTPLLFARSLDISTHRPSTGTSTERDPTRPIIVPSLLLVRHLSPSPPYSTHPNSP